LEVQKFASLGKFCLAHQLFDKSPQKAFLMETASPLSPDSSGHSCEFIQREWQRRTFNVETRFEIFGAFREKEDEVGISPIPEAQLVATFDARQ